jgi:hypothetical protein
MASLLTPKSTSSRALSIRGGHGKCVPVSMNRRIVPAESMIGKGSDRRVRDRSTTACTI